MSSSSCFRAASAACRDCLSSTTVTTAGPTRLTKAARIPAATPTDLPVRAPSAAVSGTPAAATVTGRESTLIVNGSVCSGPRLNAQERSCRPLPYAVNDLATPKLM